MMFEIVTFWVIPQGGMKVLFKRRVTPATTF